MTALAKHTDASLGSATTRSSEIRLPFCHFLARKWLQLLRAWTTEKLRATTGRTPPTPRQSDS